MQTNNHFVTRAPSVARGALTLLIASVLAGGCVGALGSSSDGELGAAADRTATQGLVRRADGEVEELTYVEIDGFAVIWGDVIAGRPADAPIDTGDIGGSREAISYAGRNTWPNAVVPYEIDSGLGNQQRVHDAIKHYRDHTSIRLVPRNGEADYVRFVDGSGCLSYVGRIGGAQEITLADGCTVGSAIHEIGHAIGMIHEQQRPDRDDHVVIHYDNVQSGFEFAFDIVESAETLTPYDLGSRMHYFDTAFSNRCDENGRNCARTITRLDGSGYTANTGGLSALDIQGIESMYDPNVGQDVPCAEVSRVAGASRYSTAVALNDAFDNRARVAFVVAGSGGGLVDALAVGPYARSLNGAVLLTQADTLPAETREALNRWRTEEVYVVGGPSAVSDAVRDQIAALPSVRSVERIAGPSRYGTAAAVSTRFGRSDLAFIVSGDNRAVSDALAASGPAGQLGAPILLVSAETVPQETRDALASLGVRRTYVIGGGSVISDAVFRQLPSPTRIAGASRFSTAVAVARELSRRENVDTSTFIIVRSDPVVDALAGAGLGLPVLYSHTTELPSETAAALGELGVDAVLVGGESALSRRIGQAACQAL